jgi:hypothetical protein
MNQLMRFNPFLLKVIYFIFILNSLNNFMVREDPVEFYKYYVIVN